MPVPLNIVATEIPDVLVVETTVFRDKRGFFLEVFSEKAWHDAGMHQEFVQDNLSQSAKGTLRGMHYQINPHGMSKLVRAVSGSVFDVAVDLRDGSPTFGKWVGRTLSGENGLALWIPVGFAHGFMALEDDSILMYKCTNMYTPDAERSFSYADPEVNIKWPMKPVLIADKDADAPMLRDAHHNFTLE